MQKLTPIQREISLEHIAPEYSPALSDVQNTLSVFSHHIHSVYIYGSIVTGKAKIPDSDLDILILLKRKLTEKLSQELKQLEADLSLKYKNILREVGFSVTYKNEVLRGKEITAWRFFISILCIKIIGEELIKPGLKFYPTSKLGRALSQDFKADLVTSKEKIETLSDKKAAIPIKHIMKTMLRVAYFIVMERDNSWTLQRGEMARIFLKYYPDKSQEIRKVMDLIANPTNKKEAVVLIDGFGRWITTKLFPE